MPTTFGTYNPGDTILDTHIEAFNAPINNLETGAAYYAADGGSTDAYAVTLSPVPTSYTAGQLVHFKANTANIGAATLNVNALGAKTIKKHGDQDLASGDIIAGQLVSVLYDGTNFQLQTGASPRVRGVQARSNANKSVATGTYTALNLQVEDYDTNAYHDTVTNNHRHTVPTGLAGKYQITGSGVFDSNATGFRLLALAKNGTVVCQNKTNAINGSSHDMMISAVLDLADGDTVEMQAYQNSGSALNVQTGAFLGMVRLGA